MLSFTQRSAGTRGGTAAAIIVLLWVAATWPAIALRWSDGRGADDQKVFHLPAILQFSAQWPRFDFRDYSSMTTPAYHVGIAAVDRWVTRDLRALQLAGNLVSAVFVGLAAYVVGRRAGTAAGVALTLPLTASLYIYSAGVWLLPDNAAWLSVLCALLLAFRPRVTTVTWYLAIVATALFVVAVRQTNIWCFPVLIAAAWLGGATRRESARSALFVSLACLPAMLLLGYFFLLWKGAAPPQFKEMIESLRWQVPIFILALLGVLGVFYLALPMLHARNRATIRWKPVVFTAAAAFLAALTLPTDYNPPAGRWSGLWNIVARLPAPGGRSVLVVPLAALGAAVLAILLQRLNRATGLLLGLSLVLFACVQIWAVSVYQRYYEPLLLILFALLWPRMNFAGGRALLIGPFVLAVLLAMVTVLSL